jgi:hypothetical protein
MSQSQHLTLRGLAPELEKQIRSLARRERISLNKAALRLLEKGAGLGKRPDDRIGDSLDHLIGTWKPKEAAEFLESIRSCDQIDPELWESSGSETPARYECLRCLEARGCGGGQPGDFRRSLQQSERLSLDETRMIAAELGQSLEHRLEADRVKCRSVILFALVAMTVENSCFAEFDVRRNRRSGEREQPGR